MPYSLVFPLNFAAEIKSSQKPFLLQLTIFTQPIGVESVDLNSMCVPLLVKMKLRSWNKIQKKH